MRPAGLVLSLLLAACDGRSYGPFAVQLVDEGGGAPFDGSGTLTVTVLQDGAAAPDVAASEIVAGAFELDLPIPSYEPFTVIHAQIEGDGEQLIGATTPFYPFDTPGAFARVVMGPPGQCLLLSAPALDTGRRTPGVGLVSRNLVAIGGERMGGDPVGRVDVYIPYQLTDDTSARLLETLSPPFGRTRIMPFAATTELLVVGDDHAIRFETGQIDSTRSRVTDQPLHAGAGSLSAMADLGAGGIAVLGGRSGDAGVDGITVVRAAGSPLALALATPRSDASAIALAGGILVAGGQAEGAPLFEWVGTDGTRLPFGDTAARSGGTLVRGREGLTAFYYLGADGTGAAIADTWVVDGCPAACRAMAGPTHMPLRTHAVAVPRSTGTIVLGGDDGGPSNRVEEVRLSGTTVEIVPLGPLRSARRDLTAIALGSDFVLVAGGEGVEGTLLPSMELCLPERLPPIALP